MYSAARIDMFFPMEFQGKSPKMADVYLETSMKLRRFNKNIQKLMFPETNPLTMGTDHSFGCCFKFLNWDGLLLGPQSYRWLGTKIKQKRWVQLLLC